MIVSGFIQFHISLGWTGVAFGFLALALRIPDLVNRWWTPPSGIKGIMEMLHSLSGGMFIVCSIFMPITANWIWPRFGTPYEVVWFISSMFLAMICGVGCIRLRRYLLLPHHTDDNVSVNVKVSNETDRGTSSSIQVGVMSDSDVELPLANTDGEIEFSGGNERSSGVDTSAETKICNKQYLVLKYLHAMFMTYSLVMLLGAGQAFLSNSRMNQFPYPRDEIVTDSLIGRCYGRNLVESEAPTWLSSLACGLTSYCQESSRGGSNPYYHENGFI